MKVFLCTRAIFVVQTFVSNHKGSLGYDKTREYLKIQFTFQFVIWTSVLIHQRIPHTPFKQTLLYRSEWQNAALPRGMFSEEIVAIKMSSESRKGKICYCKVKVNQAKIQNCSSITILHYFSDVLCTNALKYHIKKSTVFNCKKRLFK